MDVGLQGLVVEMRWYTWDGTGHGLELELEVVLQICTWMTVVELVAVQGNHRDIGVELKAMAVTVHRQFDKTAVELLEGRKVESVEEMRLRQGSTGGPACCPACLDGKVAAIVAVVDILDIVLVTRMTAPWNNVSHVEDTFDFVMIASVFALESAKTAGYYGFVP